MTSRNTNPSASRRAESLEGNFIPLPAAPAPQFDEEEKIPGAHITWDVISQKLAGNDLQKANDLIERCVTERTAELEAANRALRESEQKFHQLFATVRDAILVFDAETRQFVEVNDAALRMYGYTREELQRLTAMDLTAEPEASEASIHRTAAGEPNLIPLRYHRKKDGTIFPVEISASTFVLHGRTMFCGIVRDITERKQAEAVLQDSNERLKKVLEIETVGVMFLDLASGTLIDANDTFLRLTGYTRRELEARELTWEKLTPPEFLEASREQLRKVAATGRVGPYEKEYFRKDGTRQWFIFAGSHVGNGTVVEFCVDISAKKRAESDLRKSEERYRALVEQSPDGLFVIDARAGCILDFNSTACRMFGYSREESLHLLISSLVAPEEIPRVPVEIAKLTQGETVVTEWLARRKDGSLFHCEIRAQQFANGQIQGFVRDITERKEASERFAQSQRARAILSGVDYAIVHTQNQKQLLAECCRVAVEKGGFKLAWIGMVAPDGTIQPVAKAGDTSYLRGFHAVVQDVPDGHGPVSRAIREKRPIIIEDMDRYDVLDPWRERARQFGMSYVAAFPIRIASRLAGSFQVYAPRAHFFDHDEVHLLTQVSDELSFALTAMDAAASRRHAEQELRKSERDLADFFASSPVGLLWVAANGCILRANQAELNLLGRDEKAVLGRPVGDFHADPEAITALLDRLAAGETVHDYHTRLRQKNGDIIHVLIDANGLWEKQRLVHSRWFIRDITRRVELEREVLNASDEERQRLGQDLHDDLCQQLTGIHFLSEALARSLKEKPDADAADAREITQLARNALNQAREMAHGLSPIQVDAEGLMEGLNTLAAYTRKVFRRECHFQCPAPVLIPDQTVALHLYRIAQEAVNNAVKHGRARRIDIKLGTDGNKVVLAVRDYGLGLPQASDRHTGMGLRVMQYRAGIIGGSLVVQRLDNSGTEVVCTLHDGLLPLDAKKTK